jgi:PAS domain-containing protein
VVRLPTPLVQRCAALLRPLGARALARMSRAQIQFAWPRPAAAAGPGSTELLDVALEALNIARDSKALVVARHGTIIDINRRALDLCGYPSGDLLGKNVMAVLFARRRGRQRPAGIRTSRADHAKPS